MSWCYRAVSFFLGAAVMLAALLGTSRSTRAQTSWNFDTDTPGQMASGFSNRMGRWLIVKEGDNQVLFQRAENRLEILNIALVEVGEYKDIDLTVRLKSVKGENERGGGLVWRAKDKDNYYLARYNPYVARHNAKKGANLTLFKVENGKRSQLDYSDAPAEPLVVVPEDPAEPPAEWHTLRITTKGREIEGYLDGKKLLQAEDSTFESGKIGIATKSDARTYFDDLTVTYLGAKK